MCMKVVAKLCGKCNHRSVLWFQSSVCDVKCTVFSARGKQFSKLRSTVSFNALPFGYELGYKLALKLSGTLAHFSDPFHTNKLQG